MRLYLIGIVLMFWMACNSASATNGISPAPVPNAVVQQAYSYTLSASGGTPPYSWSIVSGSLPEGLSLSTGGTISGTPIATGTSSFTVLVRDTAGHKAQMAKSLTVENVLQVSTSSLTNANENATYSFQLQATGGVAPYAWSWAPQAGGSLPPGLSLNAQTGVLSGTPSASGSYPLLFTVSDSIQSGQAVLVLIVDLGAVSVLPATVTLNGGVSQQFTAMMNGSPYSSVSWYVNGVLGGNATIGQISALGYYTAPNRAPDSPYVTITAVNTATPTDAGTASVLVPRGVYQTVGNDYYVSVSGGSDSNSGSLLSPWKTIGRSLSVIQAGDTVHVLPGVYPESIVTPYGVNGTATAPIRFVSEIKWAAQVTGYMPSSNCNPSIPPFCVNQAFQLNGSFMMLEGFDITNLNTNHTGGGGHLGVDVEGQYDSVKENRIHDVNPLGCLDQVNGVIQGGAAIVNGNQAAYLNVIGNWIYNIGDLSVPCYSVHGIYDASTGGTIYDNVVFKTQGWGIQLWHAATNIAISNNTVFNNANGGILVGDGDDPCTGNGYTGCVWDDYTIVTNNIVVYNQANNPPGEAMGGYGISENGHVGSAADFGATSHNMYQNNLVYGNANNSGTQNGIFVLYHMTYPVPSGNLLTAPLFVNYQPDGSGDYHLQATSPAIGSGTSQGPAPAYDFEGVPRPYFPGSNWDIGAYQYNGILY